MEVNLSYHGKKLFIAKNEVNASINFDGHKDDDGQDSSLTPMETMLSSVAACSGMDVVAILNKKRKTITDLKIKIVGERRDEHPRIFTSAKLIYTLISPDTEMKDLERSIELSQDKYCGASAMFKLAGADVTYEAVLVRG